MRILAIRGENLASLSGPFEVDFEAEPIGSSGIFAITGPTGAGKTTILDAICLALFDGLPRMDTAERGALIGRVHGDVAQQVKYDDVRGILRHGAGGGYAEVDFVGQDGRRYRSRWEVNHARGKASGKLQNQKITLTEIESGEVIGDKKTDTLQQIEKRIGLSFGQFRRSVLLAQGDFDTFIKAGSKDRAELLEKITGTEIYSRISQAAFARAKQEREALRDLETQLGEHQPLKDEERVAAEGRVKEAKSEVDRIEAEKAILAKAKDWYETKARLDARVLEGEAALGQALKSDGAAEPDRASFAIIKKAFALRAELEATAAASDQLARAEMSLSDALTAEQKAADVRDKAVLVSTASKADRDGKRAAYDAIGPELDKAQRLDAVIETAKTDLANLKNLLERSIFEKDAAGKAVSAVEAALKAAREERESDSLWLDEHKSAEALSARIEDVTKDLSERTNLEGQIATIIREIEILDGEVRGKAAAREAKEHEVAALQAREREFGENIASLRKIVDEIDRGAVETKRDTIIRIQGALDDAKDAAEDAGKEHAGITTANEEAARQDLLILQACEVIAQVDAELPTDTGRLEEARRSLDLSQAAGSKPAEHLRLKLKDGQPCPVCGATQHPVTDVDRLLKDRVSVDQGRVTELDAKVSAAQIRRTRAETQIMAAKDALQGISGRKSGHEGELKTARERWRASVAAVLNFCGEIGVAVPTFAKDAAAAEAAGTFGLFRNVLNKILSEAKEIIKRASDAESEVKTLSSDREISRADLTAASGDISKLRDEEHSKTAAEGTLRAALQGMEQNLATVCFRLVAALAPVFPDWREKVTNIGGGFAEICRSLVDKWRECRNRIETAGTKISSLGADLQGKRATLIASEASVAEAEKQHVRKKCEFDKLAAERVQVIGGRPAGEVRTEYRKRWEAAEKVSNEAEAMRSEAEKAAVAATSNAVSARNIVNSARAVRDSTEGLLAEKLQTCEISRAQAESGIAKGEGWVATEQKRLDTLQEAVANARATLAERQQSAKEHEAAGRPEQTREEIAAALTAVDGRRVKVSEEFIEASSVLRNDDHARSRIAEIKATLDERWEMARVWGQLDDLIGSADGSKFRRFAQSLTFNHLIRLANQHLADLHPRYELQRAPGGDLVLQVIDRNMADEVRGVHNLSGGERFLVSLALALGLASMSSSRGIKVESLFIDEGFGALDSNSLAMAVSVLEQLQATGRRVGIISHVDELKERIAVRVEITPVGSGRSTVQIVTA